MEYNFNKEYYKGVVYLLLNKKDKTYYIGKTDNIELRIITHIKSGILTNNYKIFILEHNINITDLEYIWLNFSKYTINRYYKCLNKSFNTGNRFKVCGKTGKIHLQHIKTSNYYKFCKEGIIEDTTGLIDEEIILLKP